MTRNATSTDTADAKAVAIFEGIRTGKWRQEVKAVREAFVREGKEAANKLKPHLPGFLCSGKFERRANAGLVAHSGLLCADLDALDDRLADVRKLLLTSPYIWAVFLSPTGTGLKVIVRVAPDERQHAASFNAVMAHIRDLCGVEIDPACKDVARLCFVSYDPDAFLNRDAMVLAPLTATVTSSRKKVTVSTKVTGTELPPSVERLLATGAPAGERNNQAFKLAAQLRDARLNDAEAESRIREFAARCQPPLDQSEALATLRSAYATPAREPARNKVPSSLKISNTNAANNTTTSTGDKSAEDVLLELAALTPMEYDGVREAAAKQLGVRVGTLDVEVAQRRVLPADDGQGTAVEFPAVEPWPYPVDGPEVLSAVVATFVRYVALPPHAAVVLALWAALTHAFEAFLHSPRLNLCSPEKGCGKTLVLDVLASLVPRSLRTESITPAVLFRLVEQYKPTLLLDEIDTYLHDNDELRGLLNAGHKRGAKAYRCEGDQHKVRAFAAFAPAVLAGIGALPGTLHDRSLIVRLVRAKPGEVAARFDSRHTHAETELCRKLARWVMDNRSQLERLDPSMPEGAFNRLADNWRPLFAVAQVAGGDWPKRATAAFIAMTADDELDAHGIGASLLADISSAFASANTDRLASAKIVEVLATMDGKPWPEFKNGKAITTNQVARLLARFNIRTRTVRIGDTTAKGYHATDFEDAFARFLPSAPASKRNTVTSSANIGDSSPSETSQTESLLLFENSVPANVGNGCDGVTLPKGEAAQCSGCASYGSSLTQVLEVLPAVVSTGQTTPTDSEAVML